MLDLRQLTVGDASVRTSTLRQQRMFAHQMLWNVDVRSPSTAEIRLGET
jgi:hypothetical protein